MDLFISQSIAIALALTASATSEGVGTQADLPSAPPSAQASRPAQATSTTTSGLLAMRPVDSEQLARIRGGTDTLDTANFMNLRGNVSNTRATDLVTGNNSISDGAFSGSVGLPMVIQNSGNNVLIQNATIINVRIY